MHQVVPLAQAQAQGSLGLQALCLEQAQKHVVGQEYPQLHAAVVGELPVVVGAVVTAEVAPQHLRCLLDDVGALARQLDELGDHAGVARALPREGEHQGHGVTPVSSPPAPLKRLRVHSLSLLPAALISPLR